MASAEPTKGPNYAFTIDLSVSSYAVSPTSYLIRHAELECTYVATGTFIFNHSQPSPRILLLQRSESDSMPGRWEVPGGGCDEGDETILHAAARELWEEAGIRTKRVGPLVGKQFFTIRSGRKVVKFNLVVEKEADNDGETSVSLNPEEHQRYVWATLDEVKARKAGDVELVFASSDLEAAVVASFVYAGDADEKP
jgi:8-oxo-dGTP pyrophosphatase MutT (NUDIX family)